MIISDNMTSSSVLLLFTVFNRRDATHKFLKDFEQNFQNARKLKLKHAVMCDDGSVDGSSEMVRTYFPWVEVVAGSGREFWAGGMRRAYAHVENKISEFDYICVANNDIELIPNAIQIIEEEVIDKDIDIFVGTFAENRKSNVVSYGGLIRKTKFLCNFRTVATLDELSKVEFKSYDALNMNFCIMKSEIVLELDFLSTEFQHSKADIDFGLRATERGYNISSGTNIIGYCSRYADRVNPANCDIDLSSAFKELLSIKWHPIGERVKFCRLHGGFFWPIGVITPYVKFIVDLLIYRLKKNK